MKVEAGSTCKFMGGKKINKNLMGVFVYSWPEHYPQACPPDSAKELVGTIYRFINGTSPAEKDFLSHYERNPSKDWGHDACKARGLSVLRTLSDCGLMRKAVPALRKKRVAVADISTSVGLVAITPSNSCDDHNTWWRAPLPSVVFPLFSTIAETQEAGHA